MGVCLLILLVDENKQLEKLVKEANFSEMGVWERTHMEEWIAKRPEILGEKLLTITTEYDSFDKTSRRLDILAVDTAGKLVIIELKRDVAETFVDLQAIHYAAYCSTLTLDQVVEISSDFNNEPKEKNQERILNFIQKEDFSDFDNQPRIILVANDFKEETLAAVLWLRDSDVDIKCVKLEAYKLDEKIVITPDIIIPLPEAEKFMFYRGQKNKTTSNKEPNEYFKFWSKILSKFIEIKPEFSDKKPSRENFLLLPTTPDNRIHFEWMIRKRPSERFAVALHFEYPKKETNKKACKYFYSLKNDMQEKLPGEKLYFEKFGSKSMQIYIKRDSNVLDDENIEWGVNAMLKFYEAIKPMVDEFCENN